MSMWDLQEAEQRWLRTIEALEIAWRKASIGKRRDRYAAQLHNARAELRGVREAMKIRRAVKRTTDREWQPVGNFIR